MRDSSNPHAGNRGDHWRLPGQLALAAVTAVLAYFTVLVVAAYGSYFPPDFDRGFLANKREIFFRSGYFLGFYLHITAAPVALLVGALGLFPVIRRRAPRWHRRLGFVYAVLMLALVAPGGLVMSLAAYGGWSSTICFALLSVFSWWFTCTAWRAAKRYRFAEHGRWMVRSYLLLSSALWLRLLHIGLIAVAVDARLAYQISAWLSWLLPWFLFETVWLGMRVAASEKPTVSAVKVNASVRPPSES